MKKIVRNISLAVAIAAALGLTSCRDTDPGDPDYDMGMTTDSVLTENDSIDNTESTVGANTELDGE